MSEVVNPALLIMKDPADLKNVMDPKDIIAADVNGKLVRTDYTALKNAVVSGAKKAVPATVPTPWSSGDPDLFEKYDVNTAGTYTNFKKNSNGDPVIIESADLDKKMVQIWVTNGIAEKIVTPLPQATQYIAPFEGSTFPIAGPAQRTYNNAIWQLDAGINADSADIPGVSSKWSVLRSKEFKTSSIFSTNLFNPDSLVIDKYVISDGSLTNAQPSIYATTDYIAWGNNTKFMVGKNGVASYLFSMAQYDDTGNFIAGSYKGIDQQTGVFSKVSGAEKFRITVRTADTNQINFGDEILAYEEYFEKILVKEDMSDNTMIFKPDINDSDLIAKYEQKEIQGKYAVNQPNNIYTVCNTYGADIYNGGFLTRNYSLKLYVDHLIDLRERKHIEFESTKTHSVSIYAPIASDLSTYNGGVNILQRTITDKLIGGIKPTNISFNVVSTLYNHNKNKRPIVLTIGDSTVLGFNAGFPEVQGAPAQFWAWSSKFFDMDKANDNTILDAKFVGKNNVVSYDNNGTPKYVFAEGRGGWTVLDYLTTQAKAGVENYFYDVNKTGPSKFSVSRYLARFKTLADDGITRLTVGVDAGTEVTDSGAYNLCTPTHVVIQLGFNDPEMGYKAYLPMMIATIKEDLPNSIVVVNIIDQAGTLFPENYPDFDSNVDILKNPATHIKMFNLYRWAIENVQNTANKVFVLGQMFVQPTAHGMTTRSVNLPESIINSQFKYNVTHGTGYELHPNRQAHASWGYHLYSFLVWSRSIM